MQWYAVDFGSNARERLQYVQQYLSGQARDDLAALLADGKGVRVEYKPYDWSANESA